MDDTFLITLQVLLFILFICSCATLSNLSLFVPFNAFSTNLLRDTNAAAGWLLFVTIVAAIVEGLILVSRFLNFGFARKFGTIIHIVVSTTYRLEHAPQYIVF